MLDVFWLFYFQKQEKYGCPTNGKNVGAEKILSGDKAAIKAQKKPENLEVKQFRDKND